MAIRSAEHRRGYGMGYYAGSRRGWPAHRPPEPPAEMIRKLFQAASELRDCATGVCQVIECDTEPFIDLQNKVAAVDDAFEEIGKWLKDPRP